MTERLKEKIWFSIYFLKSCHQLYRNPPKNKNPTCAEQSNHRETEESRSQDLEGLWSTSPLHKRLLAGVSWGDSKCNTPCRQVLLSFHSPRVVRQPTKGILSSLTRFPPTPFSMETGISVLSLHRWLGAASPRCLHKWRKQSHSIKSPPFPSWYRSQTLLLKA